METADHSKTQVKVRAVEDTPDERESPEPTVTEPVASVTGEPALSAALTSDPPGLVLIDVAPPERDRIVVLGRRQSGKTIFLANLYAGLWRGNGSLTAKALTGNVHKLLMDTHAELRAGRWPAATLGNTRLEFELEYHGEKHLMISLDFAGEVFARAFLLDQAEGPEARELLSHIDHAAAVLLLVDPSVGFSGDHQAAMEDDFGLVQAVQRIRNWPGGSSVPIVIILTKMDQYKSLADQAGGAAELVRRQFPALVRTLGQVVIFQVSATQVVRGADGKAVPAPAFVPVNLENPIKHCLRQIAAARDAAVTRQISLNKQLAALATQRRERRQNIILAVLISLLLLFGAGVCWGILHSASQP